MEYDHTQTGRLHHLLYVTAAIVLAGAWLSRGEPVVPLLLVVTAVLSVLLAESFRYLTVRDEGDCLVIRYGPIPLFGKRIPYADITAVEKDRSSILDGWGIHWTPGRGWTYNVWGLDCVKLTLGSRVIRVGTDDVENLAEFLRVRIGGPK